MTHLETSDYVKDFYAPVYGLVLAGGLSKRMGEDKALIEYHGVPQYLHAYQTLNQHLPQVYVSVRPGQLREKNQSKVPELHDIYENIGPFAGILRAMDEHPDAAWLVVSCDLPFLDSNVIENLVKKRNPLRDATAYLSSSDQLPEPLCAIWEPRMRDRILDCVESKIYCPRKLLLNSETELIEWNDPKALDNCNTRDDLRQAKKTIKKSAVL